MMLKYIRKTTIIANITQKRLKELLDYNPLTGIFVFERKPIIAVVIYGD